MPLVYDPEMSNGDNYIELEEHDFTDVGYLYGCAIFPAELGADGLPTAFFEDDFELELSSDDGGTWQPAVLFRDYTYGPIHLRASVACSRDVYSNIIVYNHADKLARITYRGLGDHADTTFLQEVTDAGVFDRNDPALWLLFQGQAKNIDASQVDSDVAGQSPLEVLNSFLGKIVGLMTGAGEISPVLMDLLQEMIGDLETWKNEIINSIPTGGGGGVGEPLAEKLVLLSGRPNWSPNLGTQVTGSLIGNNVTILAALQNLDVAIRDFKTDYINNAFRNGVTATILYDGGITLDVGTYRRRAIVKGDEQYILNIPYMASISAMSYTTTGVWDQDKVYLIGRDGASENITVHTNTDKVEALESWVDGREAFEKQVFSNTIKAQVMMGTNSPSGPVMIASCMNTGDPSNGLRRFPMRLTASLRLTAYTAPASGESVPYHIVNACQGPNGDLYTYSLPTAAGSAGLAGCIRRYTGVFDNTTANARESNNFPVPQVYKYSITSPAQNAAPTYIEWGTNAFGGANPPINPSGAASDVLCEMYADPLGVGLFFSTQYGTNFPAGNVYRIWHVAHANEYRRAIYTCSDMDLNRPECFTTDRFGNIYVARYNNSLTASQRNTILKISIARADTPDGSWVLSTETLTVPHLSYGTDRCRITAMKVTPSGHIYLAFGAGATMQCYLRTLVNPNAGVEDIYPALSEYGLSAAADAFTDALTGGTDWSAITGASSLGYMSKWPLSYPNNWWQDMSMWAIRRLEIDENETCIFGVLAGVAGWNESNNPGRYTYGAICSYHHSDNNPNGRNARQIHREDFPIDQFAIRPVGGGEIIYGVYNDNGGYCGPLVGYADIFYTIKRGSGRCRNTSSPRLYTVFSSVLTTPNYSTAIAQRSWLPTRSSVNEGRAFQGCTNPKILIPCGPYELGGWGAKI